MKKITCALFLIVNFQSLAFGKTILKDEECKGLSSKVSISAFSFDTNGALLDPYGLRKGKGVEYFAKTRAALENKMNAFCKSDKAGVTVEDFRNEYHNTCAIECQDQSSVFKDPLIGANKPKRDADTVCLTICNKTLDKLDMFIEGIELGKKHSQKPENDCTAGVSDSSRNKVKVKDIDAIIDHVKSSSNVAK